MLHGVGREESAADRRGFIPQEYVAHISIKLKHISDLWYAVTKAEGPEERLRMLLQLSENMSDKADLLENCGFCLLKSFIGNANRKENIDNCILAYESAVHLTPQGHTDMSSRLNMLGVSFFHRFNLEGDLTDMSKAILYQQKALRLTPDGHADMPGCLNNLGKSFQCRFKRTGDLEDITNAISHQQKAVRLAPEGHADIPTRLSNLANSLVLRFEHTGDLTDISDAISLDLTPEGHACRLNNLGNAFRIRFERTGELFDISDAILYLQKAVSLTPECHAVMPCLLSNLGNSFQCHFEKTRDPTAISDAITYLQKAVRLTPEGHVDIPGQLNDLGNSLRLRFELDYKGDLTDISDAIKYQQRAVHLTPEDHAEMPSRLSNVGISFHSRFEQSKDLTDISEAISYKQRAINLTPEGHAGMLRQLNNLGNSFQSRFEYTGDLSDIHVLLSIDRRCATYSSGSPSTRLMAAIRWARHSKSYDPPQSLEAYNTAIQLVSQVAGLEQTIQKRHTNLKLHDISDLAADAAAWAINLGKFTLALEWLKQCRCLIWSQLNQLQTPLDTLFARDPNIASHMSRVFAASESRGNLSARSQGELEGTVELKMSLQDEANTHVKLAQEWSELITKIRTIPEFEGFLQPTSFSNLLKNLPVSGPIIVITGNVHKGSYDAMALLSDSDKPLHIPLHEFSYAYATNLRNQLITHLHAANVRMRECELDGNRGTCRVNLRDGGVNRKIKHILRQLWILVVKPILDGLKFPVSTLGIPA